MRSVRFLAAGAIALGMVAAQPAAAQFFLKSPDLSGPPVRGDEPGVNQPMPTATDKELRAALIWNLRAALNVAALQCGDFAPTLMTIEHYNAMLTDHKGELKSSFDTLSAYFNRVNKSKALGQKAFDSYGTKTYSSYSTITAQIGFCQTASKVGRDMIFTPRGQLGSFAATRLREVRNSLVPYGEQAFPRYFPASAVILPRFDKACWKKGRFDEGKCAASGWGR